MLPFRFLIPLALLSLVAAPAHSTILAQAAVRTTVSGGTFTPLCEDGGLGETSADVSCADGTNSGHGSASADYGSLGIYAKLYSGSAISDNDDYQAYGWARFSDEITLLPGLIDAGEWTDARVVFNISGQVDEVDAPTWMEFGDMFIPWEFTVTVGGLELQPSNGAVGLGKDSYYDFDITPGTALSFSAELIGDVRCFGCDVDYEGILDLSHTASLLVVQVKDPASGLYLDPGDFTITSGEGASYANVVPEPGTGALLGVGLVGLAVAGRRPRHA
ncbi:MAG: PEP-CTERM sorting domain-containing protein [Deltaproteobacteria bacterium]|nr:PEP-CTERM sorting domain-containing protein [Deltaproteobacteria bacterium]